MSINNNNNNNNHFTDIRQNNNQMYNNNMHINNINQQINNNINFNNMINFNNNNNMNNNLNMNIGETGFQNDNMASNFKMYYSPEINNKNNNDTNINDVQNNEDIYQSNESTMKMLSKVFPNSPLPLNEINILQKGNFSEDEINKIKEICVSYFDFAKPNDQKNADKISQMIKQKYENTEWFVLCCEKSSGNNEDFDFKFTYFENNNTLILCEKKVLFYICKL